MIPTVVAAEVVQALRDFLITGFKPSNPELASVIEDFLAEPTNLVRGPYLSLALPFQEDPGDEPFPEVPLGFTPYSHQRTAMERLANVSGRSTVVATGTGSGKTECYLLPILDHCREQAGKPGIKAIIIYPMNALAMDQADSDRAQNPPQSLAARQADSWAVRGRARRDAPQEDGRRAHHYGSSDLTAESAGHPADELQDAGLPHDPAR